MTREEAIKHLSEWMDEKMWRCFGTIDREAIGMAIEALKADAVSLEVYDIIEPNKIYCSPQLAENVEVVVRCKDCRYRNGKVNRKGFEVCDATGMDITDNDYCSWGERREAE